MNLKNFSDPQKFEIHSIHELQKLVKQEIQSWPKRLVVLLSGPMGSGKTEFVKQWGILTGAPVVTSPTYAIHQNYQTADHFDLYRLNDESELESTGFWDLFSNKEGLIFVEWPEKLSIEQLPKSWDCICYQFQVKDGTRFVQKLSRSAL